MHLLWSQASILHRFGMLCCCCRQIRCCAPRFLAADFRNSWHAVSIEGPLLRLDNGHHLNFNVFYMWYHCHIMWQSIAGATNWRLYHLLCAICPAVGLLQLLHSECHAQFSVQNCRQTLDFGLPDFCLLVQKITFFLNSLMWKGRKWRERFLDILCRELNCAHPGGWLLSWWVTARTPENHVSMAGLDADFTFALDVLRSSSSCRLHNVERRKPHVQKDCFQCS